MTSRSSESAGARRAAINLVGVHHAEIRRGQELAAPGYAPGNARFSRSKWSDQTRPFARCAIAGATSSTWARPRSRPFLSLLESNEAVPAMPQLAQLFLAEPVVAVSMASRSCCGPRARRRRWGAAGSSAIVAPHRRRDQVSHRATRPLAFVRSARAPACAPWPFSGSLPGPSVD